MIAEGQSYSDTTVNIDGATYRKCRFSRCNIVFHGVMPFSLEQCDFAECKWSFAGNALLTVKCMAGLYGQGGGGQELIEAIFSQIRAASAASADKPAA